jgi:hypothetical protein
MNTQAPSSNQRPHQAGPGQGGWNFVIGSVVVLALALGLVALGDRMLARAQVAMPTVATSERAPKPIADQPTEGTSVPDAATALKNKAADPEPAPQAF